MAASPMHSIGRQVASFGVIGVAGYIVDVGLYNLLTAPSGPLPNSVLTAKTISTAVAMALSFAANRTWTFPGGDRRTWAQVLLFVAANAGAAALTLATLAVSHYLLGFTSTLADNISGNVVGVGLGTVFRFWAYRRWVFNVEQRDGLANGDGGAP